MAVIVQSTLDAARQSESKQQAIQEREQKRSVAALEEIFAIADTDGADSSID